MIPPFPQLFLQRIIAAVTKLQRVARQIAIPTHSERNRNVSRTTGGQGTVSQQLSCSRAVYKKEESSNRNVSRDMLRFRDSRSRFLQGQLGKRWNLRIDPVGQTYSQRDLSL